MSNEQVIDFSKLNEEFEDFGSKPTPISQAQHTETKSSPVENNLHTLNPSYIEDLAQYIAAAEDIKSANQFTAPLLLGKLSTGLRKAGDHLAAAKYNYGKAYANRKRMRGIAALSEFPKWIRDQKADGKDVKGTDKMMEYYVDQHPDVVSATEQEAYYEAVCEQLNTIKTEMFMAITSARAIVYGFKDSNQLSSIATPDSDK
jgi:hypothetical protein